MRAYENYDGESLRKKTMHYFVANNKYAIDRSMGFHISLYSITFFLYGSWDLHFFSLNKLWKETLNIYLKP
jgi:hypothetical protein